jgi:hypothetical protein
MRLHQEDEDGAARLSSFASTVEGALFAVSFLLSFMLCYRVGLLQLRLRYGMVCQSIALVVVVVVVSVLAGVLVLIVDRVFRLTVKG